MFAMFATLFRALTELFQAAEVLCRSTRKGADLIEVQVDTAIAEAKANQLAE